MKEYAPKGIVKSKAFSPSPELIESRAIAMLAAENLDAVLPRANGRLSKPELGNLLAMVGEGKSTKAIKRTFNRLYNRDISESTIAKYRKKYATKITEYANDFEFCAINEGLARRAVRVTRLKDVAEALEESILLPNGELGTENSRLIGEYRETLKQIAQEVGDMPTGTGDITFVNMSDKELLDYASKAMAQHKDLAVIMTEKAGVRPSLETIQIIDADGNVIVNG